MVEGLLTPEEIKELQEDLRVGSILVAKLTDQCRELEAQLAKVTKSISHEANQKYRQKAHGPTDPFDCTSLSVNAQGKPERPEKKLEDILCDIDNQQKIEYPTGSAPWAEDPVELNIEKVLPLILALYDVEGIRKQERERIYQELVDVSTVNDCVFPPRIVSLTMTYDKWLELGFPDWRALKEGEKK